MASDIAAEDARQIGNADIAMLAEWDELQKAFDNSADKPESWDGLFEKEKGRIRTQVMAGATQPRARAKIGTLVDTKFANWKSTIGTAARSQARRNQARDFAKGMEILNQVPDYEGDVGALQGRIKTTDDYIERQPYLTPNEKLDARRDYRQTQIAGYLLQAGDEQAIDNPNNFATVNDLFLPGFEGDQQALFGPDEIAAMKRRYSTQLKNAGAQGKLVLEAAKIKAENKYQEMIVAGDYPADLAMQIETDPAFDAYPETSKGLINWMSQYSNAALSRKEAPTESELLDAHNEIYDADNPEEAKKLLAKHAPMFKIAYGGSDHTITLLKEIRKQETEGADPILRDGIDMLKRTRDTHLAALKKKKASLEDIAAKDISWSRRMNELRTTYRNNPDWGPKEKLDYQEQLTAAAKEEVSREWLSWLWYGLGPITGSAINYRRFVQEYSKIKKSEAGKSVTDMTYDELLAEREKLANANP
jgi:hypothetical protein